MVQNLVICKIMNTSHTLSFLPPWPRKKVKYLGETSKESLTILILLADFNIYERGIKILSWSADIQLKTRRWILDQNQNQIKSKVEKHWNTAYSLVNIVFVNSLQIAWVHRLYILLRS